MNLFKFRLSDDTKGTIIIRDKYCKRFSIFRRRNNNIPHKYLRFFHQSDTLSHGYKVVCDTIFHIFTKHKYLYMI